MTTDEAINHLDTVAELRREIRSLQRQVITAQSGLVAVMVAAIGHRDVDACYEHAAKTCDELREQRLSSDEYSEYRAHFAIEMMAAWRGSEQHGSRGDSSSEYFAKMAVTDADALIAALEDKT